MLKIATFIVFVDLIRQSLQAQETTGAVDKAHSHIRRLLQGQCRVHDFGNGYSGSWCATCIACNTTASNGSLTMDFNCYPCGRYSFNSSDNYIQNSKSYNYSSYDNIQREFYTDCNFIGATERCKWRTKCIVSQWSKQFECYENPLNITISSMTSKAISNYSSLGYVEANCTSNKSIGSSGSLNFTINCVPASGYNYKSGSYRFYKALDKYAGQNRRIDAFYTDCFGSYDEARCWWVTYCERNTSDQDFGFNCTVFSGSANYSQTIQIFNYSNSLATKIEIFVNCSHVSVANSLGNITSSLRCEPRDDYINQTRDNYVQSSTIANYTSEDGKSQVFRTDCWGNRELDECFAVIVCSKNIDTWFGFGCMIYSKSDNRSNQTIIEPMSFSNNTTDGRLIGGVCNLSRLISWKGIKRTGLSCAPSNDYKYSIFEKQIATREVWNSTTYSYGVAFYADCWESYWSNKCGWIATCFPFKDSSFGGWNCRLEGTVQGTVNQSQSSYFYSYSTSVRRWLESSCTATNSTDSTGMKKSFIKCVPNQYYYTTTDRIVHERQYSNWSSPDGQSISFTTDCWGPDYNNDCWWITVCSKANNKSFGWDCSVFGRNNSNGSNTTNTTTSNYIFSNYSYPVGYMYSNCTATNGTASNGSRFSNISCTPSSSYNYKTYNKIVHNSTYYNWSAPDNTGYFFSTDCWGSSYNECWWISTCTRSNSQSSFGWNCAIYHAINNSSNSTSDWNTFSNYSYTGGLSANCTATNKTNWDGSIESNITCRPQSYSYKTYNTQINMQKIYNWSSSDGQSIVFSTDCWGKWYEDQCYFITSCTKARYYNSFGYNCIVYSKNNLNSSNSSNGTNCINFNKTNNWWEPEWCANCTACNYTSWNGSLQSNITCSPCRNYSYSTTNFSVESQSFTNYSSQDYTERRFSSDCGSNGCGWCASALKDWSNVGFNIIRCSVPANSIPGLKSLKEAGVSGQSAFVENPQPPGQNSTIQQGNQTLTSNYFSISAH